MVLAAAEYLAVGCHVLCRSRNSRKGEKEEELAMPSICRVQTANGWDIWEEREHAGFPLPSTFH